MTTKVPSSEFQNPIPRRADERYRALMDRVADYAIVGLDGDGVVKTWNRGAELMKGYLADEIIGQHFSMFYRPDDRAVGLPMRMLDEARTNGHADYVGWRVRKDGTQFWAEVTVTVLRGEQGQIDGFVKVTRDLTQRHNAEEAVRQSEERFRMLVSRVTDYAVIGLDPQGVVQTWNPGAARVKGYIAEEVIGQHFSLFYTPEDSAKGVPTQMLDTARANGHAFCSGWRVRKDGTLFWGDVVITAMRDDNSDLIGFIKVTRDLTERHATEEMMREAIEREKQATARVAVEDTKRKFLDSVSHDLRNPLTAIQGYVDLLGKEDQFDAETRKTFLTQIDVSAKTLTRMLDHVLETARLGSGTVALNIKTIEMEPFLREMTERMSLTLGDHSIEITAGPDLSVDADPQALERVLINLLTNAAKFSAPAAPIRLSASREDNEVIVSVGDECGGLEPDVIERVFEPFFCSTPPAGTVGTGLGLSIVREYVSLQHGRVWVESEPGQGCRFSIALPTPEPPAPYLQGPTLRTEIDEPSVATSTRQTASDQSR